MIFADWQIFENKNGENEPYISRFREICNAKTEQNIYVHKTETDAY